MLIFGSHTRARATIFAIFFSILIIIKIILHIHFLYITTFDKKCKTYTNTDTTLHFIALNLPKFADAGVKQIYRIRVDFNVGFVTFHVS